MRRLRFGMMVAGAVLGCLLIVADVRSRSGGDVISAWRDVRDDQRGELRRKSCAVFTGGGWLGAEWETAIFATRRDGRTYRAFDSWRETLNWRREYGYSNGFPAPSSAGSFLSNWSRRIGFSLDRSAWTGIGVSGTRGRATVPLWVCWMVCVTPAVVALCRWSRHRRMNMQGFEISAKRPVSDSAAPGALPAASRPPA